MLILFSSDDLVIRMDPLCRGIITRGCPAPGGRGSPPGRQPRDAVGPGEPSQGVREADPPHRLALAVRRLAHHRSDRVGDHPVGGQLLQKAVYGELTPPPGLRFQGFVPRYLLATPRVTGPP